MPYGTVNADVIQTSTSGGILGAGNASIMKNRIINGAMVISQAAGGASVAGANGTYAVDRWQGQTNIASKFTMQQNAGSVTPPTGFINYLGLTSSSAYTVGAGEWFGVLQGIEGLNIGDLGWGTASAKTVTLSFQVYSSLTGTFGGALFNNAGNRSYPFSYSIPTANTWTTISVTIAGDTSGTWLTTNSCGIYVNFSIGSGSTYSGTAGSWSGSFYRSATGAVSVVGTNGATFYITGVQLEVGSSATGFEYVNYETSLANCQRYYEVLVYDTNGQAGMSAPFSTVADSRFQWLFKVQKRANPSYSVVSGSWGGNTPSAYFSVSHIQFVTNGTYFFLTGSGGSTAISASAEL
jgi:hypothetical protein